MCLLPAVIFKNCCFPRIVLLSFLYFSQRVVELGFFFCAGRGIGMGAPYRNYQLAKITLIGFPFFVSIIGKFLREENQFLCKLFVLPTILPPPVFCRPRQLCQSPPPPPKKLRQCSQLMMIMSGINCLAFARQAVRCLLCRG